MRWYSIPIALSVLACSKPRSDGAAGSAADPKGSAAPTEVRPAAKKPVDTKPRPPLAKDPGGATGKPLRRGGLRRARHRLRGRDLAALAAQYQDDELPNRVARALRYAQRAESDLSVQLAIREFKRLQEEEELAVLMLLAMD